MEKTKDEMVVYTSICMNYLPKALILGESLKKYNSNIKFFIILLEREIPKEVTDDMYKIIDKIILAKDLGFEDFDKFIFKHSIVEASTSVKGQALVYLLENVSHKVLYIDPDIKIYNSLDILKNWLDEHDIILTPHLTIPEENEIDISRNELCAMRTGIYNLGFLGVNDKPEGLRFAKWWRDRLHLYCYDDIPRGIFTDQRWIDLAVVYFDCYIIKNLGCNMGPWNFSTRKLSRKNDKLMVNDKDELVFFHFSGFDSGSNLIVFNEYVKDKDAVEFELRNEYLADLDRMQQQKLGKYGWSYANYFSGEKISNSIRRRYRDLKYFDVITESPFSKSNSYFKKVLRQKINIKEIHTLMLKVKHKLFKD